MEWQSLNRQNSDETPSHTVSSYATACLVVSSVGLADSGQNEQLLPLQEHPGQCLSLSAGHCSCLGPSQAKQLRCPDPQHCFAQPLAVQNFSPEASLPN